MDADRSSADPARVGPQGPDRDPETAQGRGPDADGAEEGGSSPSLIARLFGRRGGADEAEEDAAPAASSAGERAMLVNVRRLRELRVIDVMVPRADIEAVELATSLDDLVAAFRQTRHTRLPVYRETLDDPLGFIHLKDLALRFGFNGNGHEALDLRPLVRPMLYVPPSMPIEGLLQKMQGGRMHMALVIDEYGGVDGLVTIADVLEQIVGDIEDEHDVADAFAWRRESEGVYICAARLEIPEFEAAAGGDLQSDDLAEAVAPLGGLVF
ncbi:MAG: CBS domain-containing protein, partial [Pseudomonadota bacterium]|nr:CBS domain-containing protein [Pseudomonadota bacterium]